MRDTQKNKFYRAERILRETKPMKTIGECEDYLNKILHSRFFRTRYPFIKGVWLKPGQGARIARGCRRGNLAYLKLPRWARTPETMLHELAHSLTPPGCAAHGREFARDYLGLVTRFLGREAGAKLKASYRDNQVKHRSVKAIKSNSSQYLGSSIITPV